MKSLILLSIVFLTQNVLAAGGTWCLSQTTDTKVEVHLLNSRLPGAPVLGGDAKVEFLNQSHPSKTFAHDELVGWWDDGKDIKMHFLRPAMGQDRADTQLIVLVSYNEVSGLYEGQVSYVGPQREIIEEAIVCELE